MPIITACSPPFFQDELDIGDADVLGDCAAEIGLDKQDFWGVLDSGFYSKECEQQLILGRDIMGINSVPTFVLDNRLGITCMCLTSAPMGQI